MLSASKQSRLREEAPSYALNEEQHLYGDDYDELEYQAAC